MRLLLSVLVLAALIPGVCARQAQAQAQEVAYEALQTGEYDAAREAYRELLDDAGGRGEAAVRLAEAFIGDGAFEEGLRTVDAYLREAPEDGYLLHARGRLLEELGRLDDAGAAYRASVEANMEYLRNILALGMVMERRGQFSQAGDLYSHIFSKYRNNELTTADDLGSAAMAAARLGEFRDANEAFRLAYRIEPGNVQNLYWWAELFREKFNDADAQRTFQEGLTRNPHFAPFYTGMARSVNGFEAREQLARKALEENANSVDAHSILAGLAILDGMFDQAESAALRALDINPASVEALAHLASSYYLRGDTARYADVERRALAVSPRAGDFYITLSRNSELKFRYPDAIDFALEAVQADRRNPQAYAQLGISLLRLGRSQEARRYLEFSFEQDPYNLFVGNTLELLDSYENFALLESPNFRLLIHNDERDVLGPAVLALSEQAFAELGERYPYTPAQKIFLEAYNDPDDFAVRIAGVPHLGLLGVSFGDVLAINTPRGQEEGSYNWARTLWHELVHTLSIGVADYRLPRWFAEGLAVYEEQRARPEWGREMELDLLMAFEQDKLLPLSEIDRGFTRPSFPGQILLSYYHASQIVAIIAEEHGFDAIVAILQGFARGDNTATSVQNATGMTLDAVDAAFAARMTARGAELAPVLAGWPNPFIEEGASPSLLERFAGGGNALVTALREGYEALEATDYAEAERNFRAALTLYPAYIEPGNAYSGLAAVYRATGDEQKLAEVLADFLRISEHGADQARELAGIFWERGRVAEAVALLERSLDIDPYDRDVQIRLAEGYAQLGDTAGAVRARRAILGLNPVDRADALYRLARSLYDDRQTADARRTVLQSLELAPGFRDAQRLLLQIVDAPSGE